MEADPSLSRGKGCQAETLHQGGSRREFCPLNSDNHRRHPLPSLPPSLPTAPRPGRAASHSLLSRSTSVLFSLLLRGAAGPCSGGARGLPGAAGGGGAAAPPAGGSLTWSYLRQEIRDHGRAPRHPTPQCSGKGSQTSAGTGETLQRNWGEQQSRRTRGVKGLLHGYTKWCNIFMGTEILLNCFWT